MTTEADNSKISPPLRYAWEGRFGSLSSQSALLLKDAVHHATLLVLGLETELTTSVTDDEFDAAVDFFADLISDFARMPDAQTDETPRWLPSNEGDT